MYEAIPVVVCPQSGGQSQSSRVIVNEKIMFKSVYPWFSVLLTNHLQLVPLQCGVLFDTIVQLLNR